MNITIWLLVGGLTGWQASMLLSSNGRQGLLLNIGVGIVGAVTGGWLFIGPFGTLTINAGNPSVGGFLAAFLGAVVLLVLMKLMRGIALRYPFRPSTRHADTADQLDDNQNTAESP